MNVFTRRIAPLIVASLLLASVTACQGRWIVSPDTKTPAASSKEKAPRHRNDGHRVAVIAGPAYSADIPDPSETASGSEESVFGQLIEEYGLTGEGGMLYFAKGTDAIRGDPSTFLVITVGAPERTARDLDRLRADMPNVRIITLFPTDEVLSIEAVSDLVIDIPSSGELLADENAQSASRISAPDLSFLLLAAALFAERDASVAPAARFDAAILDARVAARLPAAGDGWKIAQYVDTDTGLKARNHLVIDIPGGTP